MTSVVVCDMEPIAIEGLRSLFESAKGLSMVGAENSLADGIAAVEEIQPAVVLVDKSLGFDDVMDWLHRLRSTNSRTAVSVWGRIISESEAVGLLRAGASGVIRKTAKLETLLSCFDTVVSGATWMDEEMLGESERLRTIHSPLTTRELEVLELVERGLKNKDIGAQLGIRPGTVKIHLKHIFEKTGVRDRYGLALSGLRDKARLEPVRLAM